jgi:hypothetical protein
MSQQELLRRVVGVLDRHGIDYMVTGSVASGLQGEARATHDIDLVVALRPADVPALVGAFPPPDYYLSEQSIQDALQGEVTFRSTFNLLALNEGDKVDFWILSGEAFDQSRFARKRGEEVMGMKLKVSSPEDTILAKLRWARIAGGSEKQFTDALRVYEVQNALLDQAYLDHWAQQLDVEGLLSDLRNAAKPIQ